MVRKAFGLDPCQDEESIAGRGGEVKRCVGRKEKGGRKGVDEGGGGG